MARITLKLSNPAAQATTQEPRTLSSRAKRAQMQQRHRPAQAPAASTPAPQVPAAAAPTAKAVPRSKAPPASKGANSPKAARDARSSSAGKAGPVAAPRRPPRDAPAGASTQVRRRSPASGASEDASRRGASSPSVPSRGRVAGGAGGAPAVATLPRHEHPDHPRLSKRMSDLGMCSRREADDWISNGWVKVDGKVVDVLGTRVSPTASIEVSKAATRYQSEQVTILLNKPIGYVSGQAEDGHTPASVLLTPDNHWADDASGVKFKPAHLRGLAPAGRLDIDSTGLLVFTQDGRVARQLIGNHSDVEKEYLVRVEGTLDAAGLGRLQHGLELDGVKLRPARVSWQNEDQLRFVLREGRKRQIRRMCELVGLTVTGLKRIRSGRVLLGPLPVGRWRYLRHDETF